jgi:hypothetical protein
MTLYWFFLLNGGAATDFKDEDQAQISFEEPRSQIETQILSLVERKFRRRNDLWGRLHSLLFYTIHLSARERELNRLFSSLYLNGLFAQDPLITKGFKIALNFEDQVFFQEIFFELSSLFPHQSELHKRLFKFSEETFSSQYFDVQQALEIFSDVFCYTSKKQKPLEIFFDVWEKISEQSKKSKQFFVLFLQIYQHPKDLKILFHYLCQIFKTGFSQNRYPESVGLTRLLQLPKEEDYLYQEGFERALFFWRIKKLLDLSSMGEDLLDKKSLERFLNILLS